MLYSSRRCVSWVGVALMLSAGVPPVPAAVPGSRRIERIEQKETVASGGGRWAVVVGVDKYMSKDITPLGGAVADARATAAALVKYAEFPSSQVFTLTTDAASRPTAENVLQKLSDIKNAARATDLVLFFFAGHGVEVEGQRFLLTEDARISSPAALKLSALSVNLLMQEIENLPVAHRIVMVDACRDDPVSKARRNVATESFATAFILKAGSERGVRATFLSCKSGQSAYEWTEKGRGFFSYFIEKGLQGEAAQFGKVTVSSLETYLNEMVPQAVREQKGKEQTPFVDRSGEALVLVASDKIAPVPTAAPALTMRRVYGVIKDSNGAPLAGAGVTVAWALSGARGSSKAVPQEARIAADEDGFFTVEVPADAVANVTAQAVGYQSKTASAVPGDTAKVKLFLASRGGPPALTQVASRSPIESPTPVATAVPTRTPRPRPSGGATAKATATPPPLATPTPLPSVTAQELAKASYQAFLAEDFQQAETTAREALAADRGNLLATAVLASALAVDGVNHKRAEKIAEADEAASRALKSDSGQALAYNAKGLVHLSKGDTDAAERAFVSAAQIDSRLGAANTNLAYILFQKGKFKDAEKSYRSAIKASPDDAVPYNGLAQVLLEQNKADDAVKAVREAISRYERRDTYLGAFYVNLAVALYQQGKRDEAMEAVGRAKSLGVASNPAYDVIEKGPAKGKRRG